MATTLVPFTPTLNTNFSYLPTLDGVQYNMIVTWSLFGQRWILNIYTLSGNLVLSKPLRSSPDYYDINLIQGYFTTSTLVFRESSNNFEITS